MQNFKLDLTKGYYQVPMASGDIPKTTMLVFYITIFIIKLLAAFRDYEFSFVFWLLCSFFLIFCQNCTNKIEFKPTSNNFFIILFLGFLLLFMYSWKYKIRIHIIDLQIKIYLFGFKKDFDVKSLIKMSDQSRNRISKY